ncbi:MAG TPA: N-acyl homoserine lactonase family protein [Solidesulfovibrio magneticus]|nr:N-acyl homoserine lactonase family protein [Solidesulfovibrio magneticus]
MPLLILAVTLLVCLLPLRDVAAAELTLWRLDCGAIQVNDLDLFSDTFHFAGRQKRLANSCYLLRHDDAWMLWDAGLPENLLGAPLGGQPMSASLDKTIAEQLRAVGVAPEDIVILGASHNHFDHVGQAARFTTARLLMGQADFAALSAAPLPFAVDPRPLEAWLRGERPVETLTGDKDVFEDGSVLMLAVPGHTPGSYALLVRLPRTGPVLLSGDAAIFGEQLAGGDVPSFNADRARSVASMQRLQAIAERLGARFVLQHDPDGIGLLPAFPAGAK